MKVKRLFKRIYKKLKEPLVKKVLLTAIEKDKDNLYFGLQLRNFWYPIRKAEASLKHGEIEHQLDYDLKQNLLTIIVPKALMLRTDSKAKIQLFINHKPMWIKEADTFNETDDQSILVESSYFITKVNKNLLLYNKFSEYQFKSDKILCSNFSIGYNSFGFSLDSSIPILDKIEIFAFQNNKLRVFKGEIIDLNRILINDVSLLSNGYWKLYIYINQTLFPLDFKDQNLLTLQTPNHRVDFLSKNNQMYLLLKSHLLFCNALIISKTENESVSIEIETELNINNPILIMEDTKTHVEFKYQLERTVKGYKGYIPIEDLWNNYSSKRFFIKAECMKPKKFQFNLNKHQLSGEGLAFKKVIESQIVDFSFYIRKDHSLGLRIRRPALKKEITKIEDFKINGYVRSLGGFIDCHSFLTFEERETLDNVKIPIQNTFEIDLYSINFLNLKSKDKSIIDLFIEIINQEGKVVRKEKIKYKYAKFKKDNYYDHVTIQDDNLNVHHYLITSTPFNNLKIETFVIPNTIDIPDTSVKDDNIWLIGERYNTAQDNGIILFNWLRENTDVDAYYVIEEGAADYEAIKDNPYVLTFGSPKHYEIAFKAGVLLGTHDLENLLPYKTAKGFFHYEKTYKVFLQHGVLGRKNVEYHKKYYEDPFDLFIVSSDAEKYSIVVDKMGYEEEEVAVTGLARFDKLVKRKKAKDILLMPTWRDWINTDQQFLESEYFLTYLNLINNNELHEMLEEYNVDLHFYPHYRAQEFFLSNLDGHPNGRIKFIPFGSRKVQDLLIEHALLITDYSSVSFDFIKMNKPVIYYHFDVNRFFRRGILRPIDETFIGRIAHTEEEMLALIHDRLQQNLKNYEVDISGVIKYQDHSNCERIYNQICKNLSKRKKLIMI